jgi:hypothetical protein
VLGLISASRGATAEQSPALQPQAQRRRRCRRRSCRLLGLFTLACPCLPAEPKSEKKVTPKGAASTKAVKQVRGRAGTAGLWAIVARRCQLQGAAALPASHPPTPGAPLLLPLLLPVLPQEPASGSKSARVGSGGKKAAAPAATADKKKAPAAAAPTAAAAAKKKQASQPGSSAAEGAVKREKKVFEMPGQTRETPAEVGACGWERGQCGHVCWAAGQDGGSKEGRRQQGRAGQGRTVASLQSPEGCLPVLQGRLAHWPQLISPMLPFRCAGGRAAPLLHLPQGAAFRQRDGDALVRPARPAAAGGGGGLGGGAGAGGWAGWLAGWLVSSKVPAFTPMLAGCGW